jgi:serine/threonine protein kinase
LRSASGANLELTRIAQRQDGFADQVCALGGEWRRECVIHGDLKSDNLLVSTAGVPPAVLSIVDWELASFGDPCWDVGSFLADTLSSWLATASISSVTPPERIPSLTTYALSREFTLTRAFWKAYTRSLGLDPEASADTLLRSVRFAAVRLIQTAIEHNQASYRPSGFSICLLQLSRNILARPHESAPLLFGLSPGGPASMSSRRSQDDKPRP